MSGEARIYAHHLQRHCVAHHGTFHRSTDYHEGARTSNFAVWCESINAWALYVRSNRLEANWQAIDAASRGLLASVSTPSAKSEPYMDMAGHATSFDTSRTHVEVIFGTYVWNVIDRDGNDVSVFMHQNIDESQLAIFYAQMQAAMPNAWFVLRGAPPVNLPSNSHVEGKLDRNLPLIRDVHDTWVAQEQAFAARNGIDFLNAFQLITEYHVALNAALAPKYVGLHTLYKDIWHPCVPLVPATYVSLLPLMAVMRLRRRFKDDEVFGGLRGLRRTFF